LELEFPGVKRRKVQASFTGGEVTSDGGVLVVRQADKKLSLTKAVARALEDGRREKSCKHSLLSLLRQRVYGLCLGYEDLNDHDTLRQDIGLQTAVERDEPLASASTLCRWENRSGREAAWAIHQVLVDRFIASFDRAPKQLILDFDATDDPVHGKQEGRFFHGFYDHYCFLPLYVFCGDHLLVSYLRPSKIDAAKHAWAILALLVKRLRQSWPAVRIIFRGDSGFCRHRMLSWCERHDVGYIVGLARNARVNALAEPLMEAAEAAYRLTEQKQRLFGELQYAADTWSRQRRVIAKAEYTHKGANPRYVVTNLEGQGQWLYEELYCARGDMENRIKEQQLDLFRRSDQLPSMVGKSVPPSAGFPGLHSAGNHSAARPERDRTCPGPVFHHSSQVTKDRGRADPQHAPGSFSFIQFLPLPNHLRPGLFPPEYQLIPPLSAAPAR